MMKTTNSPEMDPQHARITIVAALEQDLHARRHERDGRWDTRFSVERDELLAELQAAGYQVDVDYLRGWEHLSDLRDALRETGAPRR